MAQNDLTGAEYAASVATTTTDGLSRSEPVLLGTYGTETDRAALIRMPGGKVHSVSVGDRLGRATVVAIAIEEITLALNGKAQALHMP